MTKRQSIGLTAATLMFFGFGLEAFAGTYTSNYLGGGIWEQDGNWSTNAYPQDGHYVLVSGNPYPDASPLYNVTIHNPAACNLGIFVHVEAVSVFSGSTLNLGPTDYMDLFANGGLSNAGLITLNATATARSGMRLAANSNVASGGEIFMNDGAQNFVTGGNAGKVFTVSAGGQIRGAGDLNVYLGDDVRTYMQWVNHGLIEAMQPVNALRIQLTDDTSVNGLINDAMLRASGSGVLRISAPFGNGGTVLNQGGTIAAIDNGTFRIASGVTVNGGTLTTSGNGTIHGDYPGSGGGILQNLTNTGVVAVDNSEALTLGGTFTNNGSVRVSSTGSGATLRFLDQTIVAGPGAITLSDNGSNTIEGESTGNGFTLGTAATLEGSGMISPGPSGGSNMAKVTNQGVIEATHPANRLNIRVEDFNNTALTNSGTLSARDGATLAIYSTNGGRVFNAGGKLEALDNSTIRIASGVTVEGGVLSSSGTGAIRGGDPNNGGGVISNVTNTGVVASDAGELIGASGTLTNKKRIRLNGGALLVIGGNLALNGNGLVTLKGAGTGIAGGDQVGRTLTVGSDAKIRGNGQLGTNNSNFTFKALNVVNHGLIEATGGALTAYIATFDHSNVLNHGGTLRAAGKGNTLVFSGPNTVKNNGRIEALVGGTVQFDNGAGLSNLSKGVIEVDGTLNVASGVDLLGGSLTGTGAVNGDVRNTQGHVAPGHSPGRLKVNGNYTQGVKGVLNIQVAGNKPATGYDQLAVSGAAALHGTLNVSAIKGFKPAVGHVYTLITAGSFSGKFGHVKLTGLSGKLDYSSNGVTLTVTRSASHILNFSACGDALDGEKALVSEFSITGEEPKQVLIRSRAAFSGDEKLPAAAEELAFEVFDATGARVAGSGNRNAAEAAQLQSINSGIVTTLAPGDYTVAVRPMKNSKAAALLEVFDQNPDSSCALSSVRTRGFVGANNRVLTGGFTVGGGSIGATADVLIRARGTSLTEQGIKEPLHDATLDLFDANGQRLATNDHSGDLLQQTISGTQLPPIDSREPAIRRQLGAGNYTAVVRGANGAAGVTVLEISDLQ